MLRASSLHAAFAVGTMLLVVVATTAAAAGNIVVPRLEVTDCVARNATPIDTRTVYAVERGTANLTRLNDCFWHCPTGQLSRKNEIDRCVEKGLMKDVLRFATEISRRIDLRMVRVDFYIIDGAVTGGEVTLASGAFNEKISLSCAESATQVA